MRRLKNPTQFDCLANFRDTKFRHLAFEIILLTSNDLKSCWKSFPDVNASSAIAVIWQHFARHESHLPFHWKKSKILAIEVILNRRYFMTNKLWVINYESSARKSFGVFKLVFALERHLSLWARTSKSESDLPNNESDKSVHLYLIMINFISSVWVIDMSHVVIAKTATSSHYRTFTICKIRNTNQKCHQVKLKYRMILGTCNQKTHH